MASEFDIDTGIDENALEKEWAKQADLFKKYSEEANKAFNDYNNMKNHLNVAKAGLEMAIRRGDLEIGCKITDKAVAAFLESHEQIVELTKEVAEAKYKYELFNSAVFSMEHKKKALENLTKLTLSDYYTQTMDYDSYRNKMMNETK